VKDDRSPLKKPRKVQNVIEFFLGFAERAVTGKSFPVFNPGTNANPPPHPRSDRLFIVCVFVDQLESLAATAVARHCASAPSLHHFFVFFIPYSIY
jgi:hypothetical protein